MDQEKPHWHNTLTSKWLHLILPYTPSGNEASKYNAQRGNEASKYNTRCGNEASKYNTQVLANCKNDFPLL